MLSVGETAGGRGGELEVATPGGGARLRGVVVGFGVVVLFKVGA